MPQDEGPRPAWVGSSVQDVKLGHARLSAPMSRVMGDTQECAGGRRGQGDQGRLRPGTAVTLSLAAGTAGSGLVRVCAREETMSAGCCSRGPDALRGAQSPQPSCRDSSSCWSHRGHRQDIPLGQHPGYPLLLASPRETSLVPRAWGPNPPLDAEGQDEPAVRSPWGSMWATGKLPSCPAPLRPGGQEGPPLPGMLSFAPPRAERGGCLTGWHRQGLGMNLRSGAKPRVLF